MTLTLLKLSRMLAAHPRLRRFARRAGYGLCLAGWWLRRRNIKSRLREIDKEIASLQRMQTNAGLMLMIELQRRQEGGICKKHADQRLRQVRDKFIRAGHPTMSATEAV